MGRAGFVLLFTLGIAPAAQSQTSADLSVKYRQITSYEVRPTVVMTPKYAPDGQVCEMIVEKRPKTETGIVFAFSFTEKEWKDVVDQLISAAERGKDLTERLNTSVDGGFITADYTYENVLIRVQGITRPEPASAVVITIAWRKRVCAAQRNSQKSVD